MGEAASKIQEAKIKDFQAHYQSLKLPFMRYANALLKNQALAEEAVHDSFLAAYDKWDSFENKSKRSTWLWSILRNECLAYFRSSEFKYEKLDNDEILEISTSDENAELQLIKNADLKQLDQAFGQLSPKQRDILEMRMSELPIEEIATLLEIPISTVKSHIHRAKSQLTKALQGVLNEKE